MQLKGIHFGLWVTLVGCVALVSTADEDPIIAELAPITQLCESNLFPGNPATNTDTAYPCTCSASPTGLNIRIDCRNSSLHQNAFEAETLPPFVDLLDMSQNQFKFVPAFQSEDLIHLDISHNVITVIDDSNFEMMPALQTLNLSWNNIVRLSIDAFRGLNQLVQLDLSRNHLHTLPVSIFSKLPNLVSLDLSRNRDLYATFAQPDVDLYGDLGLNRNLRRLHIEECGLTSIQLVFGVGLQRVHLKYNNISKLPHDLPANLKMLDLSGNPIQELDAKYLPNELQELYLMDMPNLTYIREFALTGIPKLKKLSFQGSWNLKSIEEGAFGNSTVLEELDLSGTDLKTVNNSVALRNLTSFRLLGSPIVCDCGMEWVIELHLNTRAECTNPSVLRGRQLVQLRVEELVCRRWPSWVYTMLNGVLIMMLLALCIGATWMLVSRLGPSRKAQMRKVGSNSPYARVTIEPNRAESRVV